MKIIDELQTYGSVVNESFHLTQGGYLLLSCILVTGKELEEIKCKALKQLLELYLWTYLYRLNFQLHVQ